MLSLCKNGRSDPCQHSRAPGLLLLSPLAMEDNPGRDRQCCVEQESRGVGCVHMYMYNIDSGCELVQPTISYSCQNTSLYQGDYLLRCMSRLTLYTSVFLIWQHLRNAHDDCGDRQWKSIQSLMPYM